MKYKDLFNKDNEIVVVFVSTKHTDDVTTGVNSVLDTCMQLATKYDYYLEDTKTMPDYILLIYQKYDEDDEVKDKKTDGLLEESRNLANLRIGRLTKSNLG
nr:MAG TPA: hypothetical protein [Caudoviricetes sp.]